MKQILGNWQAQSRVLGIRSLISSDNAEQEPSPGTAGGDYVLHMHLTWSNPLSLLGGSRLAG